MVVKEKRGRRRYVAFEVTCVRMVTYEQLSLALQALFNRSGQRMPKLIQLEGRLGIVRCLEPETKAVIDILNMSIGKDEDEIQFRTLYTSGTLRALRSRVCLTRPERPRG
jgi:RNase P/RNase MRP subunit POP5